MRIRDVSTESLASLKNGRLHIPEEIIAILANQDIQYDYMLKVRTSAIGSNEYLKFEELIRDENAIQNDEKLEKAIFRVSEAKQINLFE